MEILKEVVAELVKMFVADARLSVAVLILVGAVALLLDVGHAAPLIGGAVLLGGCLAILAAVTAATARRR
ncbi:hypothetical protein [Thalassobaculum fulvum]|nr:hypothetical protein [Thalassobaculum fulvum]